MAVSIYIYLAPDSMEHRPPYLRVDVFNRSVLFFNHFSLFSILCPLHSHLFGATIVVPAYMQIDEHRMAASLELRFFPISIHSYTTYTRART